MSETSTIAEDLRSRLISHPDVILGDPDLMRALAAANDGARGANVIDLRGVAMDRLEARLGQLEDTHRSVIAAAYDNLAGMTLIHRAVLRLLEPATFDAFVHGLGEVADVLAVDALRLVVEVEPDAAAPVADDRLTLCAPGDIAAYIAAGRGDGALRSVTLRACADGTVLHGPGRGDILSEACLLLDLGAGRPAGLLLLGSCEPDTFAPMQGRDLLAFLAAVMERELRRWLG